MFFSFFFFKVRINLTLEGVNILLLSFYFSICLFFPLLVLLTFFFVVIALFFPVLLLHGTKAAGKQQQQEREIITSRVMSLPGLRDGTSIPLRLIYSCMLPSTGNCLLPPYPYISSETVSGASPFVSEVEIEKRESANDRLTEEGAQKEEKKRLPGPPSHYELGWFSGFYELVSSSAPASNGMAMGEKEVFSVQETPPHRHSSRASTSSSASSFSSHHSFNLSSPPLPSETVATSHSFPSTLSYRGGCGYYLVPHPGKNVRSASGSTASRRNNDTENAVRKEMESEEFHCEVTGKKPVFSPQWLTPSLFSSSGLPSSSFPGIFDLLWLPPSIPLACGSPLSQGPLHQEERSCCTRTLTSSSDPCIAQTTPPPAIVQHCLHTRESNGSPSPHVSPFSSATSLPSPHVPCCLAACTDGTVRLLFYRGFSSLQEGVAVASASLPSAFSTVSSFCESAVVVGVSSPSFPDLGNHNGGTELEEHIPMLTSSTPFLFPSLERSPTFYLLCTSHKGSCHVHRIDPCLFSSKRPLSSPIEVKKRRDVVSETEEERAVPPSSSLTPLSGHSFDAWCSAALTIPCTEMEVDQRVAVGEYLYTFEENVLVATAHAVSSSVASLPRVVEEENQVEAPFYESVEAATRRSSNAAEDHPDSFHAHENLHQRTCNGTTPMKTTPVLLTGGDDGYLDLYHAYYTVATPESEGERKEEERVSRVAARMTKALEEQEPIWHRDRRYPFDAGVVSIAPVRRVGCAAMCDSVFSSVYDTPLGTLYKSLFLPTPSFPSPTSSSVSFSQNVEAGWVSCPSSIVVDSSFTTPYVLVGCYDESITLLDLRKLPSLPHGSSSLRSVSSTRLHRNVSSSSSCYIARKENLGGGVWRVQQTLFPFVEDTAASQEVEIPIFRSSSSTPLCLPTMFGPSRWVSERNILVLPLMQFGAGLLPYDVLAAEGAVFGEHVIPLRPPERSPTSEQGASLDGSHVTAEPLVYDTAVLGMARQKSATSDLCNGIANKSQVGLEEELSISIFLATTSFYEKRVDAYECGPLPASCSINDVIRSWP